MTKKKLRRIAILSGREKRKSEKFVDFPGTRPPARSVEDKYPSGGGFPSVFLSSCHPRHSSVPSRVLYPRADLPSPSPSSPIFSNVFTNLRSNAGVIILPAAPAVSTDESGVLLRASMRRVLLFFPPSVEEEEVEFISRPNALVSHERHRSIASIILTLFLRSSSLQPFSDHSVGVSSDLDLPFSFRDVEKRPYMYVARVVGMQRIAIGNPSLREYSKIRIDFRSTLNTTSYSRVSNSFTRDTRSSHRSNSLYKKFHTMLKQLSCGEGCYFGTKLFNDAKRPFISITTHPQGGLFT